MELLHLTIAGSVDDGKSTLSGRLMYDTKTIFEDQLVSAATRASSRIAPSRVVPVTAVTTCSGACTPIHPEISPPLCCLIPCRICEKVG